MKLILVFMLMTLSCSDATYQKRPVTSVKLDLPVRSGYIQLHGCSDVRHGR